MIKNRIKQCFIFFVLFSWILTSCSLPQIEDALDIAPDSIQAAEDSLKGAIIYGHHDLVKEAVEEGADINQFLRPARWESKKFATPILLAIQESPPYMEKYLLELGANIESLRSDYYNPAIYWSNLYGEQADDYLQYMLSHNVNLLEKNAEGDTVLDCLFKKNVDGYDGNVWERAQFLIDKGLTVTSRTIKYASSSPYGNTYLPKLVRIVKDRGEDTGLRAITECAILSDNDGVLEYLSEKLQEEDMVHLIYYSGSYCNQEVFQKVLEKGKNAEYSLTILLGAAARAGNLENVKYLIEELGAQDDWEKTSLNISAMAQAESNGNREVVDYLIKKGFKIPKESWLDGKVNLPSGAVVCDDLSRLKQILENKEAVPERFAVIIETAIEQKNMEMFYYLCDYAASNQIELDVSSIINKILYYNWDESSDMIQYILQKGEATKKELYTSLKNAIYYSNTEAVNQLLEAGADPNENEIPSQAVYYDNLEIIKLLVEYGLDVNHEGLVESSAMYSNGVMTYLINQGADISADGPNSHALFYAVNKGRIQNAKTLLDAGIDTTIKNEDGNTAYDMALMGGIDEMIALFDQE